MDEQYQILIRNLQHASPAIFWSGIAAAVFAVGFFVVGVTRTVEFEGVGLSLVKKRTMSVMHYVGCFVFSIALFLLGLDVQRHFDKATGGLLLAGLILLFPIHIYVGILRRIELTRRQGPQT